MNPFAAGWHQGLEYILLDYTQAEPSNRYFVHLHSFLATRTPAQTQEQKDFYQTLAGTLAAYHAHQRLQRLLKQCLPA